MANKRDQLYLIPAFTGLGAPYWDSAARVAFVGMDRTTGKAELARAALESTAYQITDIVRAMERDSQKDIRLLRVDGSFRVILRAARSSSQKQRNCQERAQLS